MCEHSEPGLPSTQVSRESLVLTPNSLGRNAGRPDPPGAVVEAKPVAAVRTSPAIMTGMVAELIGSAGHRDVEICSKKEPTRLTKVKLIS
jgi:hypothetical protein